MKNLNIIFKIPILCVFATLFFLGCSGEGNISSVDLSSAPGFGDNDNDEEHSTDVGEFSTIIITDVTVSSPPIVSFTVTGPDDSPTLNLSAADLRFALAKLVPAALGSGDSDNWQSYINIVETRDPGEPGTTPVGSQTWQAATENNGTLENQGDGSYTYTFATDIANVILPGPTPLPTPDVFFDPTLTHRIGMELRGGFPPADAVFTFVPDGSPVTFNSKIVKTASCNECHEKLAEHGNGRFETDYCVVCHNPGSTDALSGHTLNFKNMIHKIHRGADLPSGIPYVIWGFNNSPHDYSTVVHPQDIRNCTTCHDGSDPETPEGDLWKDRPTLQACGSCHDDVNFATGAGHFGGAHTNNQDCLMCHGTVVNEFRHRLPELIAATTRFEYHILGITNTAPGQFPVVTFSITDPASTDNEYDIFSDPEFTTPGLVELNIILGWNTVDYTNLGSGSSPAQPVILDALTLAVNNGDDTFDLTSPAAIPMNAVGTGIVAIEGHPAGETFQFSNIFDLSVPENNIFQYFVITDPVAVPRRQVVDINRCNQCHSYLSAHNLRNNESLEVCVICHNANATDIIERPVPSPTPLPDGKKEEAIDFKFLIHAIHAGDADFFGIRPDGVLVYGEGGMPHDYSMLRYPGDLNNCSACHLDGTAAIPLSPEVLDTTFDTGLDLANPLDDLNFFADDAVCIGCHGEQN